MNINGETKIIGFLGATFKTSRIYALYNAAFAASMLVVNVPSSKEEEKILLYGYEMPFLQRLKPEWRIRGEIFME